MADFPNNELQIVLRLLSQLWSEVDRKSQDAPGAHAPAAEEGVLTITAGSVKPGQPREVVLSRHGLIVNDEHGITLHGLDDSVTHTRLDGSVETKNPNVRRIEIADLRMVTRYNITQVFETVSHAIGFAGGGTYAFVTDATGKILETLHHNVCSRRNQEGVLRLYGPQFPDAEPASGEPARAD